jgi:regulator of ribonuclease activity A
MPFKTADLTDDFCNENCEDVQVAGASLNSYGKKTRFYGEIVTLKIFEDNQLVRDQVNSDGVGKVLVIDGGASMRRALLGDMLAAKAVENGWSGIIINGCIRDSVDMATMDLGVMALGTHPLKTVKNGIGQTNVSVSFAGLNFEPADFIYVDEDGFIISEKPLIKL